jgi:cytochrome b subunit of formate dehydrogenase
MTTQKSIASGIRFYINLLMIALYAIAGLILLFFWTPENLPTFNKTVIAISLLVYAGYRSRRFYRSYKAVTTPSDDEA